MGAIVKHYVRACRRGLGPYEILATIGIGGMGEVYRASDPRLRRDVAIKVLPQAFARDPDGMRCFEAEDSADIAGDDIFKI